MSGLRRRLIIRPAEPQFLARLARHDIEHDVAPTREGEMMMENASRRTGFRPEFGLSPGAFHW
jgi:hypothetical protein